MRNTLTVAAVAALAGCAGLVAVADRVSVSVVERTGRVLIISTPSYRVATPGTEIAIGERVATLAKANATLRYVALDDQGTATGASCEIKLPPNSELTVTGGEDCRSPQIVTLEDT